MDVTFYTEPQKFLDVAGEYLERHIRTHTIVATVARREPLKNMPYWFAVMSEGETIRGIAMRTHPQPPHALFVPSLSEECLAALAHALLERKEQVTACNGDVQTARSLFQLLGYPHPVVGVHTRLHFLDHVTFPSKPAGELRQATLADLPLIKSWRRTFWEDVEKQGGREPQEDEVQSYADSSLTEPAVVAGQYWFWEVDGKPVHMTVTQPARFGVEKIGPVYTPEEYRGNGYAGYVVALLSHQILERGHTPTLYTDQANPVSNKVYTRIGFVGAADEGEVLVN